MSFRELVPRILPRPNGSDSTTRDNLYIYISRSTEAVQDRENVAVGRSNLSHEIYIYMRIHERGTRIERFL